jgi:hypothetical protein
MLFGSAQGAKRYTELAHDPMGEIKSRFETLIKRLEPARVAIFIDDLDRCQSDYVIELLEGIQTLFRRAPVIFLVAADRRWLNACYAKAYKDLEPLVKEPAKPLGTLFLEKAFRFSTPLPAIEQELRDEYWYYLLEVKSTKGNSIEDISKHRNEAKEQVQKTANEGEIRNLVRSSEGRSFVQQRAIREEAAVELAAPRITERLEHSLKPYAELLAPNPRAMKRLVNEYSANRALSILSKVDVDMHQLALWTILSSRWPQLARHLEDRPELLHRIGQKPDNDIPEDIKSLFIEPENKEVERVVKGGSLNSPLDVEAIKQCARMFA